MDLDKLKKAAWDKTMSFKIFKEQPDNENAQTGSDTNPQGYNDFTENMEVVMDNTSPEDPSLGSTRRFNLRDMLSEIKKKGQEFLSEADDDGNKGDPAAEEPAGKMDEPAAETAETAHDQQPSQPEQSTHDSEASETAPSPVIAELKKCIDDINSGIKNLEDAGTALLRSSNEDTGVQSEKLDDISRRLSTIKNMLEKQSDAATKSVVNINAKLNAQDERLTDISSSLGSVSKLNDSVFDLKNTQMNTRNSIDELENSFRRLKKKMTAGVTLISILSAVLIVLEVLNLLS